MKHKIQKANLYYRDKVPGSIVFYKLSDGYTAFNTDMDKISHLVGAPVIIKYELPAITLPHQDFFDRVEILGQCGIPYQSIIYRNDAGELDVPDIEKLKEEQEIDY